MDLTQRTHEIIRTHFTDTSNLIAVDATCGNGHDTEFLCRLGFNKTYGFDVQIQAINTSKERLEKAQLNATLIPVSYTHLTLPTKA